MTKQSSANDPVALREIIAFFVGVFEDTIHMRDSALQVIQQLPDWEQQFEAARGDPLRIHHTNEFLAPVKDFFDAFLQGKASAELLDALRERMHKLPN